MLHVTAAEYRGDYRVWLSFSDNAAGEVDLASELHGPVFAPLKDVQQFRQLRYDPDAHTIVWPNGADFAPEFLRSLVPVAVPSNS